MKKLFVLLAAFIGTAYAANDPAIIGSIPNKAGGQITLAAEVCKNEQGRRIAYIWSATGKVTLFGCWTMVGDQIFIKWSDGDVFSYPVDSITFSNEFNRWYDNKNRTQYQ